MSSAVYLDSSAIVKTIIRESESAALRKRLRGARTHVSSALARAEVLRAVRRSDPRATGRARSSLARLVLVEVGGDLLDDAGLMEPARLRTLDAIHLVSARLVGSDLDAFITYDDRQAATALKMGLPVESPS